MTNDQHATLEVIAPSVEEAVEKGLAELNLPLESVEVEILDSGTRGLFGLGSRQARVRLIVKSGSESAGVKQPVKATSTKPSPAEVEASEMLEGVTELEEDELVDEDFDDESYDEEGEGFYPEDDDDTVLAIARETVRELLEQMKITAQVNCYYKEQEDSNRRAIVWVDITGRDLSILIGRRSQTLQALQYITALIVGKELGHSVPLVVDVEGYRERRQTQLRRLANSMAEQAIKTGRRQVLEPMPASERRLVHIALRNHPSVTTESIGEEPNRKVTIIPTR